MWEHKYKIKDALEIDEVSVYYSRDEIGKIESLYYISNLIKYFEILNLKLNHKRMRRKYREKFN